MQLLRGFSELMKRALLLWQLLATSPGSYIAWWHVDEKIHVPSLKYEN